MPDTNTVGHQWPPNLPPELMADIFDLACDDYRKHVRNAIDELLHEADKPPSELIIIRHEKEEHTVTPVTISQVCCVWKDIVYHTPFLWDTVFVDMKYPRNTGTHENLIVSDAMLKLKRWLDRAGNYSLAVKIKGPDLVHEPLLSLPDRWKWIDIHCLGSHPELYSEMERVIKEPLPLLESFVCRPSLHCSGLDSSDKHPRFSIKAVQNITQVTIFASSPLEFLPSPIKVCRWNRSKSSSILNQLKDMESIRDCSMYRPWAHQLEPRQSHSRNVLQLPLLENLTLHSLSRPAYKSILPSMSLPSLRSFTFSNGIRERGQTRQATVFVIQFVYDLILRSNSPHLQALDLSLSAIFVYAEILLNILRISPTLEHFKLTLQGFNDSASFIDMSKLPSLKVHGPIILKNLTSLHVDMSHMDQDSDCNATLLKYLTLPVHVNEQTKANNHVSEYVFPAALDLVKRSKCLLTTLKINTEINISETGLLDFLKLITTLECLHLVGQNYSRKNKVKVKLQIMSSLFKLLLPQSQTSAGMIYLPRLSELSCEGMLLAKLDDVLNALEYRWKGDKGRGIQRLLRARLYTANLIKLMDDTSLWHLEDLQLQGMDIKFGEPFQIEEDMAPIRY
ncbi:hypothetical protein BDQ17DRAFT_1432875 [Cyathus striatus]|nr:hypothetical protein BDQ17DRAFT_1432875 [Cyathus striatus]